MGFLFSKIMNYFTKSKNNFKLIIVGIQNVGKTTILYRMSLKELVVTQPTIGANVEEIVHNNVKFQAFDLGGQESMRSVWDAYYSNVDAIIYVVDSSDSDNITESRKELHKLLSKEELKNCVILVFANKQDKEEAMKVNDVITKYHLDNIKDHIWHIQGCSGKSGNGLEEGFQWLSEKIISLKENKFQNNPYLNKNTEVNEYKNANNTNNNNNINNNNIGDKVDTTSNNMTYLSDRSSQKGGTIFTKESFEGSKTDKSSKLDDSHDLKVEI